MYKKFPFYLNEYICTLSRRRVFLFIVRNSQLTYRESEFSWVSATALFENVRPHWESVRKNAVVRIFAASKKE